MSVRGRVAGGGVVLAREAQDTCYKSWGKETFGHATGDDAS